MKTKIKIRKTTMLCKLNELVAFVRVSIDSGDTKIIEYFYIPICLQLNVYINAMEKKTSKKTVEYE